MPFFFKRRTPPEDAYASVVEIALDQDRILDAVERKKVAGELVGQAKKKGDGADLLWERVILMLTLLVLLFLLAMYVPNEKASQTFLDCFKLAFAGTLTLFGVEASNNS